MAHESCLHNVPTDIGGIVCSDRHRGLDVSTTERIYIYAHAYMYGCVLCVYMTTRLDYYYKSSCLPSLSFLLDYPYLVCSRNAPTYRHK